MSLCFPMLSSFPFSLGERKGKRKYKEHMKPCMAGTLTHISNDKQTSGFSESMPGSNSEWRESIPGSPPWVGQVGMGLGLRDSPNEKEREKKKKKEKET